MFMRQLFDAQSSTYTYLVADPQSREAALIDPVDEQIDRDIQLISELGLRLKYALDTHVHADHVTSSGRLRERLGCQTVGGKRGAQCADLQLDHGDALELGSLRIEVLATPGHTDDSLSYRIGDHVFTGDALLIRGTGRTDFQNGDPSELYESITKVLFSLPDHTTVWPAHDYQGRTASTIGEEKEHNPRVAGRSRGEFMQIMRDLSLPRPRLIDEAVPANRACGLPAAAGEISAPPSVRAVWSLAAQRDGYRDVGPHLADQMRGSVHIVDVRERDEYTGELGHIPGAELVPLSKVKERAVDWNPEQPVLLVCRSGRRSVSAAGTLKEAGFPWLFNLEGGMVAWNGAELPIAR